VVRPNERGVLYVKSPYLLFDGYEGDPKATEAARWGDYWTVGDIAYFDEDGFYYICDRAKDMIVSGGINIYPAEVEAVIDSFPGVLECAVFGIPDERWGERVHALLVPREDAVVDPDEVIAYCREHLASYKVPRQAELVSDLPHSLAGKILKRQLRDRYWEGAGRLV
jgi:fatty-acyl-CoA synthase/long-chain acyl-CoA synthetase